MKKHYTFLLLVITILLSKTTAIKSQVDINDSLALVDLYNSTNGSNWYDKTNWLTEKTVSEWSGVALSDNRVSRIGLNGNDLTGSLPSSLGNLAKLEYLNLDLNNQLSGNIPPELGNLTKLEYLLLSVNQLSGSIPPELGKLTNLKELNLGYSQLSGSIPPELGKLANLEYLSLGHCQQSGNIPTELGNLTKLKILHLENNQLSGNIPELDKLTVLGEIYLSDNQLSGTIPSGFGKLTQLMTLHLNNNQLSGRIPSELGGLINLYSVDLNDNKFAGSLPASLHRLKNLYHINVANNNLTNTINSLYGTFPTFPKNVDVQNNRFTFDGIEVLLQHDFSYLNYTPQKNIPIHQNSNTLSVYAGGTLGNNTYKWFKDGSLVTTNIGDSTFTPTQSGAYTVQVNML